MHRIKTMVTAFTGFWRKYHVAYIIAAALVIGVIFFGLHDVGIVLGFLATLIVMVELTHRWRKIRNFVILFFSSVVGAIFLAFLHEEVVVPIVVSVVGVDGLSSVGFRIFSDAVSLVMIFIGVMGIFIGLAGTVILGISRLAGLKSRDSAAGNT